MEGKVMVIWKKEEERRATRLMLVLQDFADGFEYQRRYGPLDYRRHYTILHGSINQSILPVERIKYSECFVLDEGVAACGLSQVESLLGQQECACDVLLRRREWLEYHANNSITRTRQYQMMTNMSSFVGY